MDSTYNDLFNKAQTTTDKGKSLTLPRYRRNLRYETKGLYNYCAKIAHLVFPSTTITSLGNWSVTGTVHYNYARRLLEDNYGFQELG